VVRPSIEEPAPPGLGEVAVLGEMRRRPERPKPGGEVPDVVALVAADRDPASARKRADQGEAGLPFGPTDGPGGGRAHHEARAVLGQKVAKVSQAALLAMALAV
jgi:hypothetical protein